MTIEEHSKSRLNGAKWALGLNVNATVEEIEAARDQHLGLRDLLIESRQVLIDAARNYGTEIERIKVERDEARADLARCERALNDACNHAKRLDAKIREEISACEDLRRSYNDSNAAAVMNFRAAVHARDERDEARRLHATAVEELARVKMDAPTVNPLTIFRVLSDCKSMQYHTVSHIRALAEELSGKLGAS